jgi:arylsulfatase A-like enzyme
VIKSTADGKIDDTGPLTRKRMETVDEEFLAAALDFIDRQHKAGKPWFAYFNSTRMHVFTHLKKESDGKTGLGLYPDGMVEHDGHEGIPDPAEARKLQSRRGHAETLERAEAVVR